MLSKISTETSQINSQFCVVTEDILQKIDNILDFHKKNIKQVDFNIILLQTFLSKPTETKETTDTIDTTDTSDYFIINEQKKN
uniref:Uncharacterized protein n=1 Tax=Strongyloides venezuelensis TaxID=75913 RepID=A0A0K0EZI8_STRVS